MFQAPRFCRGITCASSPFFAACELGQKGRLNMAIRIGRGANGVAEELSRQSARLVKKLEAI